MEDPGLPEAVLFDLDDTIVDHRPSTEELWKELCYRYAGYLDGVSGDTLLEAVDRARHWYWSDEDRHRWGRLNLIQARRKFVAAAFTALEIDNPGVSEDLADSFTREREERVILSPGAVETLKRLRGSGIKLGMITNGASDMQRRKIEQYGLAPYFECITIEGEFGAGKPDISIFTHTLEQLGTPPEKAWMVGDDLGRDIKGARNTGIYSVWVDWQTGGLPESPPAIPDRIISSISELV